MKVSKLIFFFTTLAVIGCHDAVKQTEKQGPSNVINKDSVIINNQLSDDVLAFAVFRADTTKVKSLFLNSVRLKLEKQKDSEGNSYYLYHFTDGINKLDLINNNGFYLREGEIKNDKVLLNKKISIGMAKNDFLKLVNATSIKCDIIIVKDDELSFETDYIFSKSKLKEIRMGDMVE